jgi:hypothetical protein
MPRPLPAIRLAWGILTLASTLGVAHAGEEPAELTVQNSVGVRLGVHQELDRPRLRLSLPDRTEHAVEIDFPEHAWGRERGSTKQRFFYLMVATEPELRARPRWRKDGMTISYETPLSAGVSLLAEATLGEDRLRVRYTLTNSSGIDYEVCQSPTCFKLYRPLMDEYLERTWVHHPEGLDLLASETPQRLTWNAEEWLPCRYLVQFHPPSIPPERRREMQPGGITWHHKLRRVDAPFLATATEDRAWVAATYTSDATNVWSNPARSCHHADPEATLPKNGKADLSYTFLLRRGTPEEAWATYRAERAPSPR